MAPALPTSFGVLSEDIPARAQKAQPGPPATAAPGHPLPGRQVFDALQRLGIRATPNPRGLREALMSFQRRAGLTPTGQAGAATLSLLRDTAYGRKKRPQARESEEEGGLAAAAIAAGFDLLTGAILNTKQGDISVSWPSPPIGVTWPNKPDLDYNAAESSRLIINWRKANPTSGIEQVNVKLRLTVQWTGPEVVATQSFDAEGRRSRLLRDTSITMGNPLFLQTRPTSAAWRALGIPRYPVVKIPVEFRVDQPWPLDNYNETFTVVLSGMYGFGADASGVHIVDRRVVWN